MLKWLYKLRLQTFITSHPKNDFESDVIVLLLEVKIFIAFYSVQKA